MAYFCERYNNGVELHAVTTEDLVADHINVHFMLPMADKPYGAVIMPKIMEQGCRKYPTRRQMRCRLEALFASSLWASTAYYGETVGVTFSASFLKNSIAFDGCDIMGGVLELLHDVIFDPLVENGSFNGEYTKTQIKNRCDGIKAIINNKEHYASVRCAQLMCRGETVEFTSNTDTSVYESLTGSDIYGQYLRMLKYAPVIIVYAGNDTERARQFAKSVSDALGDRCVIPYSNKTPIVTPKEIRYFEEEQDIKQSHLVIGLRDRTHASDRHLCASAVFEEIFGQSPISRLFRNVRERMSLCYYCSSCHDDANGLMYISTGIDAKNRQKAQDEIFAQLAGMTEQSITKEELSCAVKSVKSARLACLDSAGAIAARCIYRVFFYGEYVSVEQELSELDSITAQDVASVAKTITADTVYFMRGTEDDNESD